VAHELLDREELIAALFASQLAMLLSEVGGKRRPDESHQRRMELIRRLALLRVDEMLASREARSIAEARYLDGHAALFPELAARFDRQLRSSQEVAASAVRAAELDGVGSAPPEDPLAFNARAGELVTDLVEPAKGRGARQARRGSPGARDSRGVGAGEVDPATDPRRRPSTLVSGVSHDQIDPAAQVIVYEISAGDGKARGPRTLEYAGVVEANAMGFDQITLEIHPRYQTSGHSRTTSRPTSTLHRV